MPSIKQKIEKDHGRTLTNRQVKSLGSRSLFLFRGSEALPLARGGLSEAQGSRFEGIKEMLAALGPLVLEHYTLLLSPAAPLRASLSPAAPLRVFPPLE
jgi:hypothetical protein